MQKEMDRNKMQEAGRSSEIRKPAGNSIENRKSKEKSVESRVNAAWGNQKPETVKNLPNDSEFLIDQSNQSNSGRERVDKTDY